jgi:hypothetical protein
MAVSFVAAGSVAGAAAGTTYSVTAPTIQAGDTLFCATISFLAGGPTPATIDGSWTLGAEGMAGGNRSFRLFWKKAVGADSEASFTITKGSPSTESHAVIFAFRGANGAGPIDPAGFQATGNASATDAVTFAALDPSGADVHVVAVAMYYQDQTDFTTPSTGFTLRSDQEGATGTGSTFAIQSKDGDSSSVTPSNWASNSTVDGFWASVVFALNASTSTGAGSLMMMGVGQ